MLTGKNRSWIAPHVKEVRSSETVLYIYIYIYIYLSTRRHIPEDTILSSLVIFYFLITDLMNVAYFSKTYLTENFQIPEPNWLMLLPLQYAPFHLDIDL
jgi:hypothetical protein